jgi:hypothetical protein
MQNTYHQIKVKTAQVKTESKWDFIAVASVHIH